MQADLQAARPCCSRPQPPVVASSPGGCSAREARPDTQPGCCKEMEGTNKNKQWWLSTDWTFNTCKKCTTRPLWKFTQVSDVLTITFYRTHTQRAHAHTHTHTYPTDPMMLFVSAWKPNIKVNEQQVNGKWEGKKHKQWWLSNSADCTCIKNTQCTHFEAGFWCAHTVTITFYFTHTQILLTPSVSVKKPNTQVNKTQVNGKWIGKKQWWLSTDCKWNLYEKHTTRPLWKFT